MQKETITKFGQIIFLPLLIVLLVNCLLFDNLISSKPLRSRAIYKNLPLKTQLHTNFSLFPMFAAKITTAQFKKLPITTGPEVNQKKHSIKLPILMYHYVEPLTGKETPLRAGLTTSDIIFNQQLKTLYENHYQTLFVKDLPSYLNGKQLLNKESVVLTFDDGYQDFYTDAFPLLKKYHLKATIYVIYDAINAPNYLTEAQLNELMASGLVELGSHTLDHTNLKTATPTEAKRQIFLSKELFEKRFRTNILTFAYPFGAFSSTTIELVKKAGYQLAVSTHSGKYQSPNNPFNLLRLRPDSDSGNKLLNLLK
jgi:peptidoglycan/xylan/chitin deacetylase (PgdA/CDA1 family)